MASNVKDRQEIGDNEGPNKQTNKQTDRQTGKRTNKNKYLKSLIVAEK